MAPRNVLTVLIVVLIAAVQALRAADGSPDFTYPDAYHYAEMGRQLARGEGFTSLQAYPYLLAWLRDAGVPLAPPWPNVTRFPLLTLLYAPVFRLAGATPPATFAVGSVFLVLTAALAFRLGARLFGAGPGIVVALTFALDVSQLGYASSGLPETAAAFFITAATLGLVALLDDPPGGAAHVHAALVGLLLGLAFLLRYDLVVLALAMLPALLVRRGRSGRRQAAWLLVGASLPVMLWMVQCQRAVGTPVAFLGFARNVVPSVRAGDLYAQPFQESVWDVLARHPEIVRAKLGTVLWPVLFWRSVFGVHLAWLGPLFVIAGATLLALRHRALPAYAYVVLAFALRSLIFTLTHHELRFYASFVPVLLVFAFGAAWAAIVALIAPGRGRRLAGAVALLLVTYHLIPRRVRELDDRPPTAEMRALQARLAEIRARTPPGTVFATAASEAVAWYAERPAVLVDPGHVAAVERLGLRVDGLLYHARATPLIEHELVRNGLGGQFVRVASDAETTVWLRPPLAQAWQRDRDREMREPGEVTPDTR